jgi:hypothetical protein
MNGLRKMKFLFASLLCAFALQPASVWACAICYGDPESDMARGLNWGIFVLLSVVMLVLGGIAAFFIYLAKRSATVAASTAAAHPLLSSTEKF